MIQARNIRPKPYTRGGIKHESTFDAGNTYHADIKPGESIRVFGIYRNIRPGPRVFGLTFKIGNRAEYDSYNLRYTGTITAITAKTVTIDGKSTGEGLKRLDLFDFCHRNWDFDIDKIDDHNAEEMKYI